MRRTVAAAVIIGLALAGCGRAGATRGDVGDDAVAVVTISGFDFGAVPAVRVGQAVQVVNEDSVQHSVTADDGSFDSGLVAGGGSAALAVSEPGDYRFHCTVHPTMTGTLSVGE